MERNFSALILAAGRGTRMKSSLPKVIHPILGKPMVKYVIDACDFVGASSSVLVLGYGKEILQQTLASESVNFVIQEEQLGTGHAVQCFASAYPEPPENLLVVCGDTPLISRESLMRLSNQHFATGAALTLMTLKMQNPGSYGRIIRDIDGKVVAISEAKDCSEQEKEIKEINLAIYMFNGKALFEHIFTLSNQNQQGEYYLTDLVEIFHNAGLSIESFEEVDETSTLGINSRADLANISNILKGQILKQHMENGVTIVDPAQTTIGPDVVIGEDTTIWPGTVIIGETLIGNNCNIGPNTVISNATLEDNVSASFCIIKNTMLGGIVPPFAVYGY